MEKTITPLNVGKNNFVMPSRILAITMWDSSSIKKIVQNAKENNLIIDATCGKRTRSVIFLDNNNIALSAIQPETLIARLTNPKGIGKIDG